MKGVQYLVNEHGDRVAVQIDLREQQALWERLCGLEAQGAEGAQQGEVRTESAYALAERLGMIGMSGDGPTDLATNPTHLEGFGSDG